MNNPVQPRLRSLLMGLILALSLVLGGCVRYDVGIQFSDQHHGSIIQHIQLGEQLTTLSQAEVDRWLTSLESRAIALRGKTQRPSPQELVVTIPFANGQDLVSKFNRFFNPQSTQGRTPSDPDQLDLLQLKAEMAIEQHNWLFFDQNRLRLTVDLRALGVLSQQGNILLSPGSLIDLSVDLQSPFAIRSSVSDEETSLLPEARESRSQALWQLKPGQINTLEAVFWVPSYLALGSMAIIGLCLGGFYAKYKRWPGVMG